MLDLLFIQNKNTDLHLKMPKPSKYVGVVKLVGTQSTHCVVWHSSRKKMHHCVFPDISHENLGYKQLL